METKKSEFNRVFNARDMLVIAVGAMVGWGWGVSTGEWIGAGGVAGAMVCFEACAMPTIIAYIYPDFLKGYLYSVAGFDIYGSWLIVSVLMSVFITYVNIRGAKTAAILQNILTLIIGVVGLLLVVASLYSGSADNLAPQLFLGDTRALAVKSVLAVAVMTPFFFIGFDVIPQAAEEINVPLRKIGREFCRCLRYFRAKLGSEAEHTNPFYRGGRGILCASHLCRGLCDERARDSRLV